MAIEMTVKTDTSLETNALAIIGEVARERSAPDIAAEAEEVRMALMAGRFNVAVVGQFKRGKSTLINSLIDRELLPSDVAPVTSAITILQFGQNERCFAIHADGREEEIPLGDLGLYASENGNPGNQKGIRIILIELPVPLLENGLRLVDTPGVGSVFEPNSETTRAFLPRIDVALVVLGSDPPITGDELELVKSLKSRVEKLCFVMNKSDIFLDSVRTKSEQFTEKVLSPVLGKTPEIIHVSAYSALCGKPDGGIDKIAQMLKEMAAESGQDLARQSASQACTYLAERLLQQIDLERQGLIEPLAKLDANIARFNASIKDIDDLMLAAKVRVEKAGSFDWKEWIAKKEEFIAAESHGIQETIAKECGDISCKKRSIQMAVLEIARRETGQSVRKWNYLASKRFNEFYGKHQKSATEELNKLVSRVSFAAAQAFGIPIAHLELRKLKMESNKMPIEFSEPAMALDPRDFLIPVFNLLATRGMVIRLSLNRAKKLLNGWLMKNLYSVDEYLVNWLDTATRFMTDAMSIRLYDLQKEISGAVAQGYQKRDRGAAAIAERLSALDRQRSKLIDLFRG